MCIHTSDAQSYLCFVSYPFDDFEYYMDNKVGIKKRPGNWNSNFFFKFNVLNNQYIIENTECETTVTFMFRM